LSSCQQSGPLFGEEGREREGMREGIREGERKGGVSEGGVTEGFALYALAP